MGTSMLLLVCAIATLGVRGEIGKYGITQLYPTIPNESNEKEFYAKWGVIDGYREEAEPRTFYHTDPEQPECRSFGAGKYVIKDGIMTMSGDTPRLYFYDDSGASPRTWENVEVTAYAKRGVETEYTSYSGFTIVARSNHIHYPSDSCNAHGYYGRARFNDGKVGFVKEFYHGTDGSTIYSDSNQVLWYADGTIPYEWIGIKFVIRTREDGTSVELQIFIDSTDGANGGDWKLVHTYIDNGAWSAREDLSSKCPDLAPAGVVLRPGQNVFLRSDFVEDVQWKKWSIREIYPLGPNCADGVINGDETGMDCGGGDCPTCSLHTYEVTPWSACSKSCGGGTQTRDVTCVENDGKHNAVDSALCVEELHDSPALQECNLDTCHPATYSWEEGEWSDCSQDCGTGVTTRDVTCRSSLGHPALEEQCSADSKPADSEECNTEECTGAFWSVGAWFDCKVELADGSNGSVGDVDCSTGQISQEGGQTRTVECQDGPTGVPTDPPTAIGPEIPATLGVLTAPMQREDDYILVPPGLGSSNMDGPSDVGATFSVLASTSTTVELECEVLTPTDLDNSFFVWFDDGPVYEWKIDVLPSFAWAPVGSTFELSAGIHTLHIGLREDDSRMRTLRISSGDAVFASDCKEPAPASIQACSVPCLPRWYACPWEACTASCGGTTASMSANEHRVIVCHSSEAEVLDNAVCENLYLQPPDAVMVGCNPQACSDANWMAGQWGSCFDGARHRTYHCHGTDGQNAELADCAHIPVPEDQQTCQLNIQGCPEVECGGEGERDCVDDPSGGTAAGDPQEALSGGLPDRALSAFALMGLAAVGSAVAQLV